MRRRKREPGRASIDEPDIPRKGAATRLLRHYGILAAVCLGVALVVTIGIAIWFPSREIPLTVTPGTVTPGTVTPGTVTPGTVTEPPVIQTESTIELPTEPAEFETQAMRDELLQLGSDLTEDFPEAPAALHAAALLYLDMQKTVEAEEIWEKCIRLSPDGAGPYIGLASAAMAQGEDGKAAKTLEQALAAGCVTADVYHELAAAHSKLGNMETAEETARTGVTAFPDAQELASQLGEIQIQLGKFGEAEATLRDAIQLGDESPSVYFSLATACARQGKTEEAAGFRQEFSARKAQQASSADEKFQDRYDGMLRTIAVASICRAATVYDHHGSPTRAEDLFLRALELDPDNGVVAGELGMFYRRMNRIADALLVQHRLVQIEPQNMPHYVNLANLSSQLGDFDSAESALKQVVAMRPDMSIGYSGLARLYLKAGNFEQSRWFAEAALRQSLSGPDEAMIAYYVLAEACQQLGDTDAAEDARNRAHQIAVAAQPADAEPRSPE